MLYLQNDSVLIQRKCDEKKYVAFALRLSYSFLKTVSVFSNFEGGKIQFGIAEKLDWSKDKTVRKLNALVKAGYVIKKGTGRGTKYSK